MQDFAIVRTGRGRLGAVGDSVSRQLRFYEEDSATAVAVWADGTARAAGPWSGKPGDGAGTTVLADAVAASTRSDVGRTGARVEAKPARGTQQDTARA